MADKLLIPHYLIDKDVWVTDPNDLEEGSYYRKDGGKFVMNDNLSQKDRAYLVECGISLVMEGGAKAAAKKAKAAENENTETEEN